ncbi:MAG TPA: type II toxin-antitoxin system RelE/ParE family toxin [Dehalococcoidia bacterium]|nr:type II toxin-antitoxin system RelE/ParE family toxin [Dehalococcoidia bacterium]
MSWRVRYTERALRDLSKLDQTVARRIVSSTDRFARTESGDVKKLKGQSILRLRVGDWRVFFQFSSTDEIEVVRVLHRADAYS